MIIFLRAIRFNGFLLQNVTVCSKRTKGVILNLLEQCSNEMAGLHTSVLCFVRSDCISNRYGKDKIG